MSVAVQAVMAGMPEPRDVRVTVHDGWTSVTVGCRVVAGYRSDDIGMRNIAVVMLTELGFAGVRVAEVMELTPEYVSTLRGRARREGSAGLVRPRGRPAKLTAAQVRQARAWRAEGLSDAEVARRLKVSDKTVARVLGGAAHAAVAGPGRAELDAGTGLEAGTGLDAGTGLEAGTGLGDTGEAVEAAETSTVDVQTAVGAGTAVAVSGSARIAEGSFGSRYAGAMLLHAFGARVGAEQVFASAATPAAGRRFDDLAVLSAVSAVFALGFASMEQAKHPDRAQVGPLAGLTVLPELRTLRPRLAGIADGCDPLGLQRAFAAAMLSADPCTSGCTTSTSTSSPTPASCRWAKAGTPNAGTPSRAGSTPWSPTARAGRSASPPANRPG